MPLPESGVSRPWAVAGSVQQGGQLVVSFASSDADAHRPRRRRRFPPDGPPARSSRSPAASVSPDRHRIGTGAALGRAKAEPLGASVRTCGLLLSAHVRHRAATRGHAVRGRSNRRCRPPHATASSSNPPYVRPSGLSSGEMARRLGASPMRREMVHQSVVTAWATLRSVHGPWWPESGPFTQSDWVLRIGE